MKRKRWNWRQIFFAVGTILLLAFVSAGCGKSDSHLTQAESSGAKFFCPMHPTYTSNRQGDCPICNMKLVPIKSPDAMKAHTGESASASVPGRVSIEITPDKQQLIGLRTSAVEKRELSRTIHATGVVQHDETKLAKITPRFGGWARDLKVNFLGQHVEKGAPLFTVYSPELFAAAREYLLAFQQIQKQQNAPDDVKNSTRRLLQAAKKRLELWQIGEAEIRAMEESGQAKDEFTFRSPVSGHVISKTAVEGKAFMAGETLYEIADLSHLWLRASIFESDLSEMKIGLPARIVFRQLGNEILESTIAFIAPHIDPETRRAEVRIELDNRELTLKPEMWADVEIEIKQASALAIPASAVIDTGARYVAFVDKGEGNLEPREVKIGARTDELFEVVSGLEEHEKVVTRALFLVDSESQLKAAISGMGASGEHQH